MKKYYFFFTTFLLYSCIPDTIISQNKNVIGSPTNNPSSTLSVIVSQPPVMTPTPTPPDQPIFYPTPTPSAFDNLHGKYIKSIGIYTNDYENPISFRNILDPKQRIDGEYNILSRETKKFRVEMILSDNSILKDTIFWDSSNSEVVSIDSEGILKAGNKFGSSHITISTKNYPSVYLLFKVNYLESLKTVSNIKDPDCNTKKINIEKQRIETINYVDNKYIGSVLSTDITYNLATFNGKVYDKNNNPIDGAKVTAFSIEDKLNN